MIGGVILIFRYQEEAGTYIDFIKGNSNFTDNQSNNNFGQGINVIGNMLGTNQKQYLYLKNTLESESESESESKSKSKSKFQHQAVTQFKVISPNTVMKRQNAQTDNLIQWTNPKTK